MRLIKFEQHVLNSAKKDIYINPELVEAITKHTNLTATIWTGHGKSFNVEMEQTAVADVLQFSAPATEAENLPKHVLGCVEKHIHRFPGCCSSNCWCRCE